MSDDRGRVTYRPRARDDLLDIWGFIAVDDPGTADRLLDRVAEALSMLADNPRAGRARPELADGLRSFPVGRYVLFYRSVADGIELARALSGHRDIRAEDMA